jgi:hypothetical protein
VKTTELFAELLIIGLGALTWIALLLALLVGPEFVYSAFNSETVSPAIFILFTLSLAYVIGIIIDRAYLPVWKKLEGKLMKSNGVELGAYYDFQINLAIKGSDELISFMDYYSSRLRILRASCVNFILATIFGACLSHSDNAIYLVVLLGGSIVVIASFSAYYQLCGKYYGFVGRASKKLKKTDNEIGNSCFGRCKKYYAR